MAYIANKPVRFDRNYAVGEVIPDEVIDPKMTRKLTEMGRILCVDLQPKGGAAETTAPTPSDTEGGAENAHVPAQEGAQDGADGEGGTNTQAEPEAPVEGAENGGGEVIPDEGAVGDEPPAPEAGGEFVCPDCGKAFGSKNALSAHSRSHKE